jgi:hypothetical protein
MKKHCLKTNNGNSKILTEATVLSNKEKEITDINKIDTIIEKYEKGISGEEPIISPKTNKPLEKTYMQDKLRLWKKRREELKQNGSTSSTDSSNTENTDNKQDEARANVYKQNISLLKAMDFKGTANKKIFNKKLNNLNIKIQLESINNFALRYKEPSLVSICKNVILENETDSINAKITVTDLNDKTNIASKTIKLNGDVDSIKKQINSIISKFKSAVNKKQHEEIFKKMTEDQKIAVNNFLQILNKK